MVERKRGTMPAGRKERKDGKTAPAGTRPASLDFDGFLRATGHAPLADLIREAFAREEPLPPALHRKSLQLFREYLLVGGMPSVVDVYVRTQSLEEAEKEKRRLLNVLCRDLKRLPRSLRAKTEKILQSITAQLAKSENASRSRPSESPPVGETAPTPLPVSRTWGFFSRPWPRSRRRALAPTGIRRRGSAASSTRGSLRRSRFARD